MLFFRKPSAGNVPVNVAFKNHIIDSGSLLIYNSGKSRLTNIHIVLHNSDKKEFIYNRELISTRSNETIDYNIQADLNGNLFQGEVIKVTIETGGLKWNFKPTAEGKFVKV